MKKLELVSGGVPEIWVYYRQFPYLGPFVERFVDDGRSDALVREAFLLENPGPGFCIIEITRVVNGFGGLAEAAELSEPLEFSDWVSVGVALPKFSGVYLVYDSEVDFCCGTRGHSFAYFQPGCDGETGEMRRPRWSWMSSTPSSSSGSICEPSHWREFPFFEGSCDG